MIQRKQSLFLLGTGICMIVMVFLNIWVKNDPETNQTITLNAFHLIHMETAADGTQKIVSEVTNYYIVALSILASIIAFASLFSYKNRLTQLKLNLLNALIIVGVAMASTYSIYFKGEPIFLPEIKGKYELGYYLPVVALFFNLIANRFIKKDEELVRSVDRIR
ncbi:DUF4293 domain-containing protein [Xanthovirga aplysinae]|uniref:DUF4293 domain-containing protein n=1 Tax=Xanthovirga aplysinae TaxID=2529853 RepID=UPI0012BBDC8B|nr:DUF4293 domain-containing protein [Xanthovirga aplysinae]MTI31670.1 DUF4293 family protein [Xanthovirga aplysinae]